MVPYIRKVHILLLMQHLQELEQQQKGQEPGGGQQLFGGDSFADEDEISDIMSGDREWTTVESNENALE